MMYFTEDGTEYRISFTFDPTETGHIRGHISGKPLPYRGAVVAAVYIDDSVFALGKSHCSVQDTFSHVIGAREALRVLLCDWPEFIKPAWAAFAKHVPALKRRDYVKMSQKDMQAWIGRGVMRRIGMKIQNEGG